LTELFTIEAINGLWAALTELPGVVLDAIRDGLALPAILDGNHRPDVLRGHPSAVGPYLPVQVPHLRRARWHRDRTGPVIR
jgi:hypothetical protein